MLNIFLFKKSVTGKTLESLKKGYAFFQAPFSEIQAFSRPLDEFLGFLVILQRIALLLRP
jgi:hypothetical protein